MDMLEDLNVNFVHIIYKISALPKNHLNYLKYNIFKCFLRNVTDFHLKTFFFQNI